MHLTGSLMKRVALGWIVILGLVLALEMAVLNVPTTRAAEGTFTAGTFTNSQGTRPYKLYIPSSYVTGRAVPLLVVLHGCSQDPDNIAAGTRFNQLAETYGFIALYPQQLSTYNTLKCWNWFETADQYRGKGEPAIIMGMVDFVKTNFTVDKSRVYVTGMSAGAAMSVIMGSCYPDVFAAIGVHSGLEYQAGTDLASGLTAQETGAPDPNRQGGLAYLCSGASSRVLPVIVFYGSMDTTVNPTNGDKVIEQFAQTNDFADDRTDNDSINSIQYSSQTWTVPGGYTYTNYNYFSNGRTLMQKYRVEGMGHAWSGGSTASPATYTDAKGPDASTIMWQFFSARPLTR